MANDDKPTNKPELEKMEKGGYEPLTEGYEPLNRRGYTPITSQDVLPEIPTSEPALRPTPQKPAEEK
jgi:hypothetical protein